MKYLIAVLLAVSAVVASAQDALKLVENGKACAELVIGGSAKPPERFAAEELSKWVEKITGAKLPVVEKALGAKVKVYLSTRHLGKFAQDAEWIADTDGFAVRRLGSDVYVTAKRPRGVLYGAYTLLEKNSDLIFARADEKYTVYSKLPDFSLAVCDFRDRPVFAVRGWWICNTHFHPDTERWNARMFCNDTCAHPYHCPGVAQRAAECGFRLNCGDGHNMHLFVPTNSFAAHPDYFAFYKGKRRCDSRNFQVCFSNPALPAFAASNLIARLAAIRIKGRPHVPEVFDFQHEDNQRLCVCERCLADIVLADGRVVRRDDPSFRTTQLYLFNNQVADIVSKVYPELRLTAYAYQFTAPAPAIDAHKMFDILFCPYPKDDKRSILAPENARWKKRIDDWAAKGAQNLVWREYYGCAASFPRPLSEIAAEDMRYVNGKLGVRKITSEYSPDCVYGKMDLTAAWDVSAMEYWILSHLYWNPYQEVSGLRKYYLKRTFRRAAPAVGKFYALILKAWYADPRRSLYSDRADKMAEWYIVNHNLVEPCRQALADAERLAEGDLPVVKELVGRLRMRFESWLKAKTLKTDPVPVVYEPGASAALKGGEALWSRVKPVDDFRLRGKGKPKNSTRVKMLHDHRNFYVRFECDSVDAGKIAAKNESSGKERWPSGERVELFFSGGFTDGRYYHLVCNAAGQRYDGIERSGSADLGKGWKTFIKRRDGGYDLTFVIDMDFFKFDFRRTNRVKAQFYRWAEVQGMTEEESSWLGLGVHGEMGELVFGLE